MSNLTSIETLLSLENFDAVWADMSAQERAGFRADLQSILQSVGKDGTHGRLTSAELDELIFADENPLEYAMEQQLKDLIAEFQAG